ncbi:sperm-associated antigen 4 protein-like isoform X4 [Dromaius novaehollandiae]|uniref:sperm-associated antigen 4 protein-like isoform X4 n=2 Tax=Dromaius novaehollandiae TaxID=8790 RepID=UPI00311E7372
MARRRAPQRRWRRPETPAASAERDSQVVLEAQVAGAGLNMASGASMSSSHRARDNAGIISRITCYLAMAIIFLRRLISTCVSAMQKMPQKKKRLWKVLFCISATLAAVYCWGWLSVGTLRAGEAPQELPEQSAVETNPLQNSLALLRQQVHKTQLLWEQVARLSAEISSVKKEVQQLREAMPETALQDYAHMSDRALRSSGATIDIRRTSKSYEGPEHGLCRALWLLCSAANPPQTILQPDVTPGQCWPFQGSRGQVVIRMPAPIQPTAVTVQHIYKAVSPSGTVSSAPRHFTVSGVDEEAEEETLLGTFMYDVEKEAMQTFPLKQELSRAFQYIKLFVRSNWGNTEFTCIYRVQVHGKVASQTSSPQPEDMRRPLLNKK